MDDYAISTENVFQWVKEDGGPLKVVSCRGRCVKCVTLVPSIIDVLAQFDTSNCTSLTFDNILNHPALV